MSIASILQAWLQGQPLSQADTATLQTSLQALTPVFETPIDSHLRSEPTTWLHDRLAQLQQIYPALQTFCHQTWAAEAVPLETVWQFWLPLSLHLVAQRQSRDRPLIQGILGGQGTGKTTLTQALAIILQQFGYRSVALSIDDFYLTYAERQALQRQDPRLIWRGPPGTHDVALAMTVLDQLRDPTASAIAIPRFDKSAWAGAGDRTQPEQIQPVDIVLFEGWFVGLRPLDPHVWPQIWASPPAPIVTEGDRQFAFDTNDRLRTYLPLWDRLDQLLVLIPRDYRWSKIWRCEAEDRMKAQGKAGMTTAEIEQFVDYFWIALHPALFWPPLIADPQRVHWVVEIDAQHRPARLYRPGANL